MQWVPPSLILVHRVQQCEINATVKWHLGQSIYLYILDSEMWCFIIVMRRIILILFFICCVYV